LSLRESTTQASTKLPPYELTSGIAAVTRSDVSCEQGPNCESEFAATQSDQESREQFRMEANSLLQSIGRPYRKIASS
jgi:hypothetical protein